MTKYTNIKFCPACASDNISSPTENSLKCDACGYVLFHNTAAATAAILKYRGKIIFVRRGHDPGKGMLDLPGGFVDYNESAEEGLLREINEETGFEVKNLKYFGSNPNVYEYKNVTYHTCDLCFTGEVEDISVFRKLDEITELVLLSPKDVILEQLAFRSLQIMIKRYINKQLKDA